MSGGPIFDVNGRLIGIHGRAEGESIYNPDTGDTVDIKSGFNLGIPLNLFIDESSTAELSGNATFADPICFVGIQALLQQQIPTAIAYFEKSLAINDQFLPAIVGMGQAKFEMGDISGAIPLFQKARELDGEKLTPPTALATALYQQGKRETALEIVFGLESFRGDDVQESLWSQRLREDTQIILEYREKRDHNRSLSNDFHLGQALYEWENFDRAIERFQKAIAQEDRKKRSYHLGLGIALYAKGNRREGFVQIGEGMHYNYTDFDRDKMVEEFWSDRLITDAKTVLKYFIPAQTIIHEGKVDDIDSISLSADGRIFASHAYPTVQVWDLSIGKRVLTLNESWSGITLSPDGAMVTSQEDRQGRDTLVIWDVATGQERLEIQPRRVSYSTRFSPDGQTITNCQYMWNVATGEEIREFEGNHDECAFSPDNRTFANIDYKTIELWDLSRDRLLHSLNLDSKVDSVAFSPNGQILATSSREKAMQLWNVQTGQEIRTLTDELTSTYNFMAFSPDGRYLASGNPLQIWDVNTGQLLFTVPFQKLGKILFNPDGQSLIGYTKNKVYLWEIPEL